MPLPFASCRNVACNTKERCMMTTVWEIGNIVIDTSLPLRWKKRERLVWKSQQEMCPYCATVQFLVVEGCLDSKDRVSHDRSHGARPPLIVRTTFPVFCSV